MSDFGLFAIEIISVSACVPSLALHFQNDPSKSDGSWVCFLWRLFDDLNTTSLFNCASLKKLYIAFCKETLFAADRIRREFQRFFFH